MNCNFRLWDLKDIFADPKRHWSKKPRMLKVREEKQLNALNQKYVVEI